MCDYEKALKARLEELEEQEKLKQEGERLRQFKKEIKSKFYSNIDEIHMEFLDKYFKEYPDTNQAEVCLIKDIFEFIKSKV